MKFESFNGPGTISGCFMGIISFNSLCYISGYIDSERVHHQPRDVRGNGGGGRVSIGTQAAYKGSILVGVKHFPEPKDSWLSPCLPP